MAASSEQAHSSIKPTEVKGLITKKLVFTAFLSSLNFYTDLFSLNRWAGQEASLTWVTVVDQIVKGWPLDRQDYLPLLTRVAKCVDELDANIFKGINKSTLAVGLDLGDKPPLPVNKLSTQQLVKFVPAFLLDRLIWSLSPETLAPEIRTIHPSRVPIQERFREQVTKYTQLLRSGRG
ncbi:hypothetical protein M422DRAFT_54890 [Sphaerobolus stellatus SS14]|uniref:Uncharacterized protein n=1 Tax=Sphaerobolus stellatus (strain SS14) TaxID=990650 RepID=A0A0C9UFK0_SPHS4|nr:hypothetical protein M422DRAFT_54890 [Sphaerobolus stellatus SS14]